MSGLISDEVIERRAREMQIASVAKRVLFIGNSLTFWNQGVDVMVKKLVPGIETQRVAVGGATLETLWNNDEAKLAVADKDIVVLQEDLPETSRESFRRYAKLWCDHVRRNGAEPVFYAAWAYDRLPAFDDDAICAEHEKVAAENNARIAHVGAARTACPDHLDLFDDDREHPSLAGTYLAACVIATTIYGAEVLQAPKHYRPKNLSVGTVIKLRLVALSPVIM